MKANDVPISETVLESLVYSVAKSGQYSKAESLVEKFKANANEVLLRTAVARAAIARNDFSVVINTIASVSNGARLIQVSNNTFVLDVLFEMLDAGEMDAIEKLSPYLTMAADGAYLAEWHVNPKVLARMVVNIWMASSLWLLLWKKWVSSRTIIFFFSKESINSSRICDVVAALRSNGSLEKCLLEKPSIKKSLARGLSNKFTNPDVGKEERITLLADLATVLFSEDKERTVQDVMELYPIIYVLGGKDVNLAIPALEAIQSNHVRREYATALVQQLLRKGDPLSDDKLEKLLDSKAVHSLNVSRIHKQISGLIVNREKQDEAADVRQLNIAARLLALSFPRTSLFSL
ncbi:hypothetical protein KIN20_006917 [Parelaphostrongylus tenuis]|uniref:Uncharacterized protein n=1 Tax=Parelaphostrongylus tenuis TaxID=148309 RepID=A0AAD5MUQ7_PARTN|nr:hypothetical protein KIN20_006917 [Parelaphostrongylus tenuis]